MLKTFLKPGWVLLLLFVVAFSYLAFTVLAPWQLGKDDDIVERNELITHAYEADPQPVEDLVDDTALSKTMSGPAPPCTAATCRRMKSCCACAQPSLARLTSPWSPSVPIPG